MNNRFVEWAPELELEGVTGRLHSVYDYLSRLNDYLVKAKPSDQLVARLGRNGRALNIAITEMIDLIQRQDAVDIGDPDINEEVVGTLCSLRINIAAASRARSLTEATAEVEEAKEAIEDLATYITDYR
jgi:hypothetical protein